MKTTLAIASLMLSTAAIAQPEDPYLWL